MSDLPDPSAVEEARQPTFTEAADRTVTVDWPEGLTTAPASREFILGMVKEHNRLVAALAATRADVDRLTAENEHGLSAAQESAHAQQVARLRHKLTKAEAERDAALAELARLRQQTQSARDLHAGAHVCQTRPGGEEYYYLEGECPTVELLRDSYSSGEKAPWAESGQ